MQEDNKPANAQQQQKKGNNMSESHALPLQSEQKPSSQNISSAELTKFQQYLECRLKKIFLVKQILLQIIKIYEGLQNPKYLGVHDIHLFIFLLDIVEYLTNFGTIKSFGLEEEKYPLEYRISLASDTIEIGRISEAHRSKLQELKNWYYSKIDLINQKFLASVEKRTPALLEEFKDRDQLGYVECLLQQVSSLLFPPIENIKTAYSNYLSTLKQDILPAQYQTMAVEELRLFYLWDYLINFHTGQVSTGPPHLVKLKNTLFHSSREEMMASMLEGGEGKEPRKMVKKQ